MKDFWDLMFLLKSHCEAVIKTIHLGIGFAFIAWWWVYFKLRLNVAPHLPALFAIVSILDFVLLMIEGVAALDTHLDTHKIENASQGVTKVSAASNPHYTDLHAWIHATAAHINLWFLISFSLASLALSILMLWHHHRMTERVRKHNSLLSSLHYIASQATRVIVSPARTQEYEIFIEEALQVLVDATTTLKGKTGGRRRRLKRIATVLKRHDRQDSFWLNRQWRPESYQISPTQLFEASAAEKALLPPSDASADSVDKGLIYVPYTRFSHGTRHWTDTTKGQGYCRMEYVRNAFSATGPQPTPQSLICMEIPGVEKSGKYVLCLDSNKWKCFQEVDFQAAHLIASMIGMVMTELHFLGKPSGPNDSDDQINSGYD